MNEFDALLNQYVFYKHYCLGVIVRYRLGCVVWSQQVELTIQIRTPNNCLTWLRDIRRAANYSVRASDQSPQ